MRFGIDLGGSKIEIIALDDAGDECYRQRVSTPQGDYKKTLLAITTLITTAELQLATRGSIGIGTPGSISPVTGLLRNSNSVCLNAKPLQQDLEKLLRRDIRLANDANCFALSEATDGAAMDAATVFAVIIGTGCGAGVVVDKQLLNGRNGISGEWGHNPLPAPTAEEQQIANCWCGKPLCIESFLSGPALSADYQQASQQLHSVQDIVALADRGDVIAEAALQRYELRLAKSLAQVINILDPHVIVLGGGLSNMTRLYDNVPALLTEFVFTETVQTELRAPKFGDSSGVRGAAWLWS